MEDKLFELMTKMYTNILNKLDAMDKKLDGKADKSDIVCMELVVSNNLHNFKNGFLESE